MGIEGMFKGLVVTPRGNEDTEKLIKRFMKKVRSDGLLNEVYLRKGYEKPSEKRRRKLARSKFLKKTEDTL
jgi:small subunit ribosomal protein S21